MKIITIAVSSLALMGTLAAAQSGHRHMGDKSAMKAHAQERFQAMDQNQDGTLTHEEMMVEAQAKFAQFDQDGNGVILLEELPVVMPLPERAERRLERMRERMQERGVSEEKLQRLEKRVEERRPSRVKFMARFDKDENEQIELQEFAAPMIKRYKRADINGDGTVTQSEFDEAIERGARKERRDDRSRRHRS